MLIDFRKLFPKYNLQFEGVLHIGGNVGEEAPVYHELGMKKQIWVEANYELDSKLRANIAQYPGAVAYIGVAAGDENKDEVVLHVSNNGSQSSSVLELGLHKIEHPDVFFTHDIVVPMLRIDCMITPQTLEGVDLLNIDVQGFDLNVLRGVGDYINQFKAVYIEVNKSELYVKGALIEDLDYYLGAYGFERVETHYARNKSWGDALYIKTQQKN